MFKMPDARKYHRHAMRITIIHRIGIPDGASRLNDRFYTRFIRNFNGVGKGEKGIRSHHRSFQGQLKSPGFINGLPQSIHPGSLACTGTNELLIFR